MTVLFFNDTATTEIYTLSLHDALPISVDATAAASPLRRADPAAGDAPEIRLDGVSKVYPDSTVGVAQLDLTFAAGELSRSEEHTSELQSRQYLVCRLLLEKKKYNDLRS